VETLTTIGAEAIGVVDISFLGLLDELLRSPKDTSALFALKWQLLAR
jgi:hypothetical protein